MTYLSAKRSLSIVVDIARSRDALMDHLSSRDDRDVVFIWGAVEGELRVIESGSGYDLEWEVDTMPHAMEPGEPARDSWRRPLAGKSEAEIIEMVFGEPVETRSRRDSATELWQAILAEAKGLLAIGPVDEDRQRALLRNERGISGQLFVSRVIEVDDFRVVWARSVNARDRIQEADRIDLTDLSVPGALERISAVA